MYAELEIRQLVPFESLRSQKPISDVQLPTLARATRTLALTQFSRSTYWPNTVLACNKKCKMVQQIHRKAKRLEMLFLDT